MYTIHVKRLAASALLLAVVASCKISKDITYSQETLPPQYRSADTISSLTDSSNNRLLAALPWNDFFVDPALKTLITDAVAKNNQLQLALKNLEIARLQWTKAKWGNVPEVQLGVQASSNSPSENSMLGANLNQALQRSHIEEYALNVGLSWEADIWGKIKNQKRVAETNYLQTDAARKAVQTALIAEVAQGYYNLLMLDYQLNTAKKNAALTLQTRKLIEWQFQSGQVSALAIAQAEAQQLNAEKLIPLFEQQITVQENALSILAGSFPNAIQRSVGLAVPSTKENLSTGLPSALVANRPDVKQAELALTHANAEVGIAKADFYPALRIGASAGVNSFELSNWFTLPASLFGTVTGGITQPILQGKRIKTNYEVALVDREKAVISFRESVLVAVNEVSNALVSIEKLHSQQDVLERRAQQLEQAISKADLLFQSGMATYLEVVIAQGQLLESELELATNKRDQLSARVSLYRALGGGWQ
ncbi:efflux transporter outer membrane subunit [Sphingobacterium psychroaquaticum]|uniref:Efflux transporter, outer membrane factor (OMF) lipoprotein, NodT family n=1 Tax=Sphingobacterium psychroaquaticum TaxID=561061 RepID=A0A1X7IAZ0_9SPHI|nr:efflux transporter outer membrane subunit [Sphingobacterium psychroaquaticum]SMG11643.1 efflux transporter, outer membrane factor (OMF) lipoprotein, NodT family [Sphingobacterium psychroaquaticum]